MQPELIDRSSWLYFPLYKIQITGKSEGKTVGLKDFRHRKRNVGDIKYKTKVQISLSECPEKIISSYPLLGLMNEFIKIKLTED